MMLTLPASAMHLAASRAATVARKCQVAHSLAVTEWTEHYSCPFSCMFTHCRDSVYASTPMDIFKLMATCILFSLIFLLNPRKAFVVFFSCSVLAVHSSTCVEQWWASFPPYLDPFFWPTGTLTERTCFLPLQLFGRHCFHIRWPRQGAFKAAIRWFHRWRFAHSTRRCTSTLKWNQRMHSTCIYGAGIMYFVCVSVSCKYSTSKKLSLIRWMCFAIELVNIYDTCMIGKFWS